MARLFSRVCKVRIGTFEIESRGSEGFRVQFEARRDLTRKANACKVTVFNLKAETRALLDLAAATKGRKAVVLDPVTGLEQERTDPGPGFVLEAGYEETSGAIFIGAGPFVSHAHRGTDWLTVIEVQDGADILREDVSLSMGPGVQARQVYDRVIGQLKTKGITAAFAAGVSEIEKLETKVYQGGKTVAGPAGDALEELAEDAGLEVSIQSRTVQLLTPGQALAAPAVVLGPQSGLLNAPERVRDPKRPKAHLVRGQALLMADIVPGRQVQLESPSESGNFKVTDVKHRGDTHGGAGSWVTEWEGLALL